MPKEFYFDIPLHVVDDNAELDGQTHPEFGDDVDVVAFNVDAFEKAANEKGIELGKLLADDLINNSFDIRAMHPVFIPGYPILKIEAPNKFPVYKSAYIASEPAVMNGANYFFVDGKTKQGWSGSPVMLNPSAMKPIPVWKSQKKDLTTELLPFAVYSGRDESDPELSALELGIAWPVKTMVLPILNRLKDVVK